MSGVEGVVKYTVIGGLLRGRGYQQIAADTLDGVIWYYISTVVMVGYLVFFHTFLYNHVSEFSGWALTWCICVGFYTLLMLKIIEQGIFALRELTRADIGFSWLAIIISWTTMLISWGYFMWIVKEIQNWHWVLAIIIPGMVLGLLIVLCGIITELITNPALALNNMKTAFNDSFDPLKYVRPMDNKGAITRQRDLNPIVKWMGYLMIAFIVLGLLVRVAETINVI